jgi:hypothetical protein
MCYSIVTQSTTCGHLTYPAWPGNTCPFFPTNPLACPEYKVVRALSDELCTACQPLELLQILDS